MGKRTQFTEHDKKQREKFKIFQTAQKWAKSSYINPRIIKILQEDIKNKEVFRIQRHLTQKGFTAFVQQVKIKFGVFGSNRFGGDLHSVMKGIAYPKYIPICKGCQIPLGRLGITTCSPECQKKVAGPKMSKSQKKKLALRTASDIAKHSSNIRKSCQRKYGTNSVMQVPEIKAKCVASFNKRSSEEKKATREQTTQTLSRNYGGNYTSPMQVPEIYEKAVAEIRKMYAENNEAIIQYREEKMMRTKGVRHQMHLQEVRDKVNKFRFYKITLGGVTHRYQGYENHVLKNLHTKGYSITTKGEGIDYKSSTRKWRKYYPDIKAVKNGKRLVIEVKSTYTFKWTRDNCPEKLFAGTKWARSKHATFLVVIVIPNKKKFMIFKNPRSLKDLAKQNGIIQSFL